MKIYYINIEHKNLYLLNLFLNLKGEAIQEANREMVIQKTNSASKLREPLTFSAQ